MNINIEIDNLRNDLVNTINASGLPIGVVELICKELYTKVQTQYIAHINSERMKDINSPAEVINNIKKNIDKDQSDIVEALNGEAE